MPLWLGGVPSGSKSADPAVGSARGATQPAAGFEAHEQPRWHAIILHAVSTRGRETEMRLLFASSLAALAVACASTDTPETQVAQQSCISREPATGSNIPTRVKCAPQSAEAREHEQKRAEELREDYRRREIRPRSNTTAP